MQVVITNFNLLVEAIPAIHKQISHSLLVLATKHIQNAWKSLEVIIQLGLETQADKRDLQMTKITFQSSYKPLLFRLNFLKIWNL